MWQWRMVIELQDGIVFEEYDYTEHFGQHLVEKAVGVGCPPNHQWQIEGSS